MEQTNFNDIVKKSFSNVEVFQQLPFLNILMGLLISFAIGMFIYYIYKKTYRGVVYSDSYNISLVLMTLITSIVIMTISTNIVLSLGMVGALSIVRFRTAVKDPRDIVFMFWAISVGIAAGAGIYSVAIIGSLFVAAVVLLMTKKKYNHFAYLLIIRYHNDSHEEVKKETAKIDAVLKSKIIRHDVTELTLEVILKVDNTSFVNKLSSIEGVEDVSLVQYKGDYAS